MQNLRNCFKNMPLIVERAQGQRKLARIAFYDCYLIKQNPFTKSALASQSEYDDAANELFLQKDHQRVHSQGSQVEGEWQKRIKGVDFDEDSEGYEVPTVFRDHRHTYSSKPEDIDAFRR